MGKQGTIPLLMAPLSRVYPLLSRSQGNGHHGRAAPGQASAVGRGVVLDRVAAGAVVDLGAAGMLGVYLDFGRCVVGDSFAGGAGVGCLGQGREAEREESHLE